MIVPLQNRAQHKQAHPWRWLASVAGLAVCVGLSIPAGAQGFGGGGGGFGGGGGRGGGFGGGGGGMQAGAPGQGGGEAELKPVFNPAVPNPDFNQADVEIGALYIGSPEPTNYLWKGEKQEIQDPGGYFYHYYYTGKVQPDARVNPGDKIERIPIRMNDWEKQRRWLVAKLTNYYQVTNNLQPTALQDYQTAVNIDNGVATPTPTPTPAPVDQLAPAPEAGVSPTVAQYGLAAAMSASGPDGGVPVAGPTATTGPNGFDPKAAAEWTLYYDQLVLWEYYCQRVMLDDQQDTLVEGSDFALQARGEDPALSQALRQSSRGLQGSFAQGFGGGGGAVGGGFGTSFGGGFGGVGGAANVNGATPPQSLRVRQLFYPSVEYRDPVFNLKYHKSFSDAEEKREDSLYKQYTEMLDSIDKRQMDRAKYQDWVKQHQAEIQEFADNWRRLRDGETVVLDNTLFLITPEKLESPPSDAINLTQTERLTPQDLLNQDGTVKEPGIE